jgi:hypothetical protein
MMGSQGAGHQGRARLGWHQTGGFIMRTIHSLQKAGPDKTLKLTIPVDEANRCYEVLIVVEPEPQPAPQPMPEDLGWPPGYFEQTAGSIHDETFVRPPQGELESRMELE